MGTTVSVSSLSERLTHTQYHKVSITTLKRTTSIPHTSPTVRMVPISTTPPDTIQTQKAQIDGTRDPLQPTDATPSCAARAVDVQNAEDRWLAPNTAKIVPAASFDLRARRHKKACSVACADRSRARGERLVGRRALVPVAPEDEDIDSRKQRSKRLSWDRAT